jgi:glutathione S-transferase
MTITVYGHYATACTIIVFCILKELGLSYEYKQTTAEEIKSPEYLATKHPL